MNRSISSFRVLVAIMMLFPGAAIQWAGAQEAAPPEPDETLIYLYQEKAFAGATVWVAVNDQTVARVKKKQYAVVRTQAGRITVSLAKQGMVLGTIALDDRPGETVYLKWRSGDWQITEIDEETGRELIGDAKETKPIDEPLGNNEEIKALLDLSRLGFDMMRPSTGELSPDSGHAVLTIFRKREARKVAGLGIWSESGYVGTLGPNQGVEIALTPGEHYFVTGYVGTTLMKAQLEAGKRYYALVNFGNVVLRVKMMPVSASESDDLNEWLSEDAQMMELVPEAVMPRIQERGAIVADFINSQAERARLGERNFTEITSEHAY